MKFYITKTPRIIKKLFSRYTWCFSSNKKEIYLTFDDGPIPIVTEFVLDQLKQYNAKATFFCIGDNITKHPLIYKQILKEGHSIGNHTYNHLNGWKHTLKNYVLNIKKTQEIIEKQGKEKLLTKLFRPPYGKIKHSQATELINKGYKIVMWDVLSADFDKKISKEKCLENVLNNTFNGSIIVFHDSIKAKEKLYYTLPKVLEEYTRKGYIFKAIY
ncbi:polysaccharide deacetylase family protein [Tenacibaculum sp. nBUS_03]|uniref:polysaccharide deacetylase family protein n=1 Tax=Tenacibaculum sp. nBUS_03 TaxID=3395320 RepID=UPI003EB87244